MTTDIVDLNNFVVLIEQSNSETTIVQKCEIDGDAVGFAFYSSGNVELETYQLPEDYIWLIDYLFTEILDGRNASVSSDTEKVLGRKATDFPEYAKATAATGVWNPKILEDRV